MGGLKKYMPITYWTFVIGAAAIAGVPGLAGFFSKDEILFQAYYTGHTGLWAIGALTGLLTACYMFRLIFMTFHGKERFEAGARARRTTRMATTPHARTTTRPRSRPSRRAARVALGDGAAAGPARRRIGRRRLRRRAARARRQQRHRDVPASELPPGVGARPGRCWRRARGAATWRPRRARGRRARSTPAAAPAAQRLQQADTMRRPGTTTRRRRRSS